MAACSSFLAPSLSNCSRNGFCSSFARSSSETTLFSGTGASFLFWRPRVRLPCFFFLIERMRLSLSPHPQLSVIALMLAQQVDVLPGNHRAVGHRIEKYLPARGMGCLLARSCRNRNGANERDSSTKGS